MWIKTTRILSFYLAALALCAVFPGVAMSQPSDIEQVEAANAAYYAALSARDLAAMEKVWSRGPRDVNIAPPIRPAAHVSWDVIKKNYQGFWGTLDELTVSMERPEIEIRGSVAWVYGIERSKRRAKNGEISGGTNFGTSIFVKDGSGWRMVFHQAALIPAQH
jgi:ketosteroid isomerase-like protein